MTRIQFLPDAASHSNAKQKKRQKSNQLSDSFYLFYITIIHYSCLWHLIILVIVHLFLFVIEVYTSIEEISYIIEMQSWSFCPVILCWIITYLGICKISIGYFNQCLFKLCKYTIRFFNFLVGCDNPPF